MQIYCYKNNGTSLDLLGNTETAIEILWTRRFFKGDDFSIKLPTTKENIRLFDKGNVVELPRPSLVINESNYGGVITSVDVTKDKMTVKGKSFDGMLERRIFTEWALGDTAMNILDKNAGVQAEEIRRFGATTFNLSEATDCTGLFAEAMRYKKLSDYVATVGQYAGWGLQAAISHNVIDLATGKTLPPHVTISGKYAVDRSVAQNSVRPVIFSDNFENATDFESVYNESGAVTGTTVVATAQYDASQKLDVKAYHGYFGDASGYDRIEKYGTVKAVTMQEDRGLNGIWTVLDPDATDENAVEIADTMYAKPTDMFNCTILLNDEWYKSFDVGDIVTVECRKWGRQANKRVTEIQEYWGTRGQHKITATLGEPYKTLNEIIKNK